MREQHENENPCVGALRLRAELHAGEMSDLG